MHGHLPQNPLKIPVLIPDSRESPGERFAQDCLHRHTFYKTPQNQAKLPNVNKRGTSNLL